MNGHETKEGTENQAREDYKNGVRQNTQLWPDVVRQNYETQYNHEKTRNQ